MANILFCLQVIDSRVDQLLHGPSPLSQSAMARQVGELYQEHSCLPFLEGSRPYLRCVCHKILCRHEIL